MESDFDEESVEDIPRSFGDEGTSTSKLKHLLPIKTSTGRLIPMAIKNEDECEELEEVDHKEISEKDESAQEENEALSAAQLFAKREHLFETNKQTIASLCRHVIENPQENVIFSINLTHFHLFFEKYVKIGWQIERFTEICPRRCRSIDTSDSAKISHSFFAGSFY